jgi:hypothetical protein
MSIEKRLQALEKRQGGGPVLVYKPPDETEEKVLARYLEEHSDKPQAVIFVDPLDWEI